MRLRIHMKAKDRIHKAIRLTLKAKAPRLHLKGYSLNLRLRPTRLRLRFNVKDKGQG